MAKVKKTRFECQRCGHEWAPRQDVRPTICPRCESPFWDRPRTLPKWKRDMIVVEPVG